MPGISAWENTYWEIAAAVYTFTSMVHLNLQNIAKKQALKGDCEVGHAEWNLILIFKARRPIMCATAGTVRSVFQTTFDTKNFFKHPGQCLEIQPLTQLAEAYTQM